MRRRDFLKLGAMTAGAVMLGSVPRIGARAQGQTPVSGGTLVWGHSETTQELDIHQTGTASTLRMLQNVHESIVTIDENFGIQPGLAEAFEASPDLLTYTFHLRPDVRFHNGQPMTARDVVYSFLRVKDPATGAVNFEVFNDVDEITALDDRTVQVRMARVYSPFLARVSELGAGVVIPEGGGETTGTMPVGTGPFEFVRREFGNEVRLSRFDEYWQGPAYLEHIVSREVTEPTVRLTGLRTGEMDVINDIPLDRVQELQGDPSFQVRTWFPLSWAFLNFNHDVPPFDDPRVRQAIDFAIDKEVLVQGALWGQGETTATPSFPNSPSRNNDLQPRPQDFDEARRLLADAGLSPSDIEFSMKVTTNYPWHVEAAQIMQDWFRTVGMRVTVEQLTWSDWLSQVWINRDFSVAMVNFFTLWEPDFLFYSLWHSTGAFNFRNIRDGALDDLLQQAREETDAGVRNELYHQVQQRIFDQSHDVILWYRNGTLAARNSVGGLDTIVHPNASNLNFWRVWLAS
jgi:ABC-type transport system substrate-binding protein